MDFSVELILIAVLVVAILTAVIGFRIGDKRRRQASGQAGPRPCRSIGDALRLAKPKLGRVLVLFLGDDEASIEASESMANDERLLALLSRPDVFHVRIRSGGEDQPVASTLFEKYARESLPEGPIVLLLDPQGLPVEVAQVLERGPLQEWLPAWLKAQPRQGRQIASPAEERKASGDDNPVAFK